MYYINLQVSRVRQQLRLLALRCSLLQIKLQNWYLLFETSGLVKHPLSALLSLKFDYYRVTQKSIPVLPSVKCTTKEEFSKLRYFLITSELT